MGEIERHPKTARIVPARSSVNPLARTPTTRTLDQRIELRVR
jgi:hypothetical protein